MRLLEPLLAVILGAQSIAGTFLPVSTFNEVSALQTREESARGCLQPVSSIDLYYMEEYHSEVPYVVQITAKHQNASYVSVEGLEHLLEDLSCSSSVIDNSTTIMFAFNTTESMTAARNLWSLHSELLFITHHASCNSLDERAVYKASMIIYDLDNLVATVTARLAPLGTSSEASSSLRVQGRPINAELRKKLRRRSSLEEYSAIAKRELKTSEWIMDLNEFGKFDRRENIINSGLLNLACVKCALKGKVAVHFDLDINFSDLVNPLDLNPFNVARLRLETLEAINGDFNIEIETTAAVEVSCSFPGGCLKGKNVEQGKKFKPTQRRKGSGKQVGGVTLDASFSLGLTVELEAKARVNVTLPVKIDVPKKKSLMKNFFGDGSATDDFTRHLKPTVGKPIFAKKDAAAQLCGFVAIGPAINFEAHIKDDAKLSLNAKLDLPRIKFCATPAHDVNAKCERGSFDKAIKLSHEVGAGLALSGNAKVGVVDIPANLETKGLYKKWNFPAVCFNIS